MTGFDVTFRKTVQTRSYETETIEAVLHCDERDIENYGNVQLAIANLEADLEHTIYSSLLFRQLITQEEFNTRKKQNKECIKALQDIYKYN